MRFPNPSRALRRGGIALDRALGVLILMALVARTGLVYWWHSNAKTLDGSFNKTNVANFFSGHVFDKLEEPSFTTVLASPSSRDHSDQWPTAVHHRQYQRLNVLLIVADDLRPELSTYGRHTHTPHLTRLAKRGVTFDRAYAQVTVCNPSRVSFMTGRRPDSTKVCRMGTTEWYTGVISSRQTLKNTTYDSRADEIFHFKSILLVGPSCNSLVRSFDCVSDALHAPFATTAAHTHTHICVPKGVALRAQRPVRLDLHPARVCRPRIHLGRRGETVAHADGTGRRGHAISAHRSRRGAPLLPRFHELSTLAQPRTTVAFAPKFNGNLLLCSRLYTITTFHPKKKHLLLTKCFFS